MVELHNLARNQHIVGCMGQTDTNVLYQTFLLAESSIFKTRLLLFRHNHHFNLLEHSASALASDFTAQQALQQITGSGSPAEVR